METPNSIAKFPNPQIQTGFILGGLGARFVQDKTNKKAQLKLDDIFQVSDSGLYVRVTESFVSNEGKTENFELAFYKKGEENYERVEGGFLDIIDEYETNVDAINEGLANSMNRCNDYTRGVVGTVVAIISEDHK